VLPFSDQASQRRYWAESVKYSKPCLTKVPLNYIPGFHSAAPFEAPVAPLATALAAALSRANKEGAAGDGEAFDRGAAVVVPLAMGPGIPLRADVAYVHLHGADRATCLLREASKHAKASSGAAAMHEAERRKHLSAAYTTDYAANLKKGLLCDFRLEASPGTDATLVPPRWAAAGL